MDDRPAPRAIRINRAPVLTLWATVVAERLGYDRDAALSLGKAVAVLNAQAKGRRLGVFSPARREGTTDVTPTSTARDDESSTITLAGRPVSILKTRDGTRAVVGGETVAAAPVQRYLERAFGDDLPVVRREMEQLAASYGRPELPHASGTLYERFRPPVPAGQKGWGARGELDLDLIRSLRRKSTRRHTAAAPPGHRSDATTTKGTASKTAGRSATRGAAKPRRGRAAGSSGRASRSSG